MSSERVAVPEWQESSTMNAFFVGKLSKDRIQLIVCDVRNETGAAILRDEGFIQVVILFVAI